MYSSSRRITDYAQVLAACNVAHIALVESETTFATVQVRLREATMEGADDQVACLEGRVTVLAPLVDRGARSPPSRRRRSIGAAALSPPTWRRPSQPSRPSCA